MENNLLHRIKKNRHFYYFLAPFFLIFFVFGLYPLLYSLYLSFVQWDGLTEIEYVGLANFVILLQDRTFWYSIWNTFVIGVLYIPPMFVLAFLLASALNNMKSRFLGGIRAAVFIPCITPMVVIAIVFQLIYSSETGFLNWIITEGSEALFGRALSPIPWLQDPQWSKPAVAVLLVWRWTGYNMVIMLAGLQAVPKELYESSAMDGANWWHQTFRITIPLMMPTFAFCAVLSLLGTFYMFDEVFVLTRGGPGSSSTNFGVYLFNKSFVDFKFGYASAAAYTVSIMVFIGTLIILRMRGAEG